MEELAQVYARSLFQVALEQGRLDEIREQLGQFADALDEHRELAVFFFSPYFSSVEKQQSLFTLLDGADEIFLNFLALLIENHRMPVIFRIRQDY
jgi:F-type H+-transporting ATPase subunit delta